MSSVETQIRLVMYFQIPWLLLIFASQNFLKFLKILSAIIDLLWSLFKILSIIALYILRLIFIFIVPIIIDFWYSYYNKVINDKREQFSYILCMVLIKILFSICCYTNFLYVSICLLYIFIYYFNFYVSCETWFFPKQDI